MQQKKKIKNGAHFGGRALLRFVYTSNVGLAFSPSDAISIEIFPSFQIAIAGDSDNIYCVVACVNSTLLFEKNRHVFVFIQEKFTILTFMNFFLSQK